METRTTDAMAFVRTLRNLVELADYIEFQHLNERSLSFIFKELTDKADDYSFGYFGCGEYSQATAMADSIVEREKTIMGKVRELVYCIERELYLMEVDILKIGEDIHRYHGENFQGFTDEEMNKGAQQELSVFYGIWKKAWQDLKQSERLNGMFPSDEIYASDGKKIVGAIKLLDRLTGETTPIRYLSKEREEREKKWREEEERLEALGKSLADYEKKPIITMDNQPPTRRMVDPNAVLVKLNKTEEKL